jgi:hypothetical protein
MTPASNQSAPYRILASLGEYTQTANYNGKGIFFPLPGQVTMKFRRFATRS